jgi:hypothetical protein
MPTSVGAICWVDCCTSTIKPRHEQEFVHPSCLQERVPGGGCYLGILPKPVTNGCKLKRRGGRGRSCTTLWGVKPLEGLLAPGMVREVPQDVRVTWLAGLGLLVPGSCCSPHGDQPAR